MDVVMLCLGSGFSIVCQRSQAAGIVTGLSLRTGFVAGRPLPAALILRFLIGTHLGTTTRNFLPRPARNERGEGQGRGVFNRIGLLSPALSSCGGGEGVAASSRMVVVSRCAFLIVLFRFTVALSQSIADASKTSLLSNR